MRTFENYPGGKAAAVAAAERHTKQDMLVRGTYWDGSRGCSIGCDLQTVDTVVDAGKPAKEWARLFGVPEWLPSLVDFIFERLPHGEGARWHVDVRRAMPEGVDISQIGYEHAARCLDRCVGYIGEGDEGWRVECRAVVRDSAAILRTGRWLTEEEAARANVAAGAAWAARANVAAGAAGAAWAARAAGANVEAGANVATAATGAAWAAEPTGAARANVAAGAAWAAEPTGAARAAEVRAQRDDLLELLRNSGEPS